jgi:hypothetical protein
MRRSYVLWGLGLASSAAIVVAIATPSLLRARIPAERARHAGTRFAPPQPTHAAPHGTVPATAAPTMPGRLVLKKKEALQSLGYTGISPDPRDQEAAAPPFNTEAYDHIIRSPRLRSTWTPRRTQT